MSALGQKQTCAVQKGMSALPPESDIKCDVECPLRANNGHRAFMGRLIFVKSSFAANPMLSLKWFGRASNTSHTAPPNASWGGFQPGRPWVANRPIISSVSVMLSENARQACS